MSHKPVVSVIIVSYNTAKLTLQCLSKVSASQGFAKGELEIIVVDNHSTDGTPAQIKTNFPKVKLIVSPKNLGFGAGNNTAVKHAAGEYLLFLNTDAFLPQATLSQLVKTLTADPSLLAVAPKLLYKTGQVQQSVGYFPTPARVVAWMWGLDKLPLLKLFFPTPYHYYDVSRYAHDLTPDWLMGAVVLLRKSEFMAVGGFDEHIFMYGEEVELFYRLKQRFPAKHNLLMSRVTATHLGSVSTTKAQASRLLSELNSLTTFYTKHFPRQLQLVTGVIKLGVIFRLLAFQFFKNKRQLLPEYQRYLRQAHRRPVQ